MALSAAMKGEIILVPFQNPKAGWQGPHLLFPLAGIADTGLHCPAHLGSAAHGRGRNLPEQVSAPRAAAAAPKEDRGLGGQEGSCAAPGARRATPRSSTRGRWLGPGLQAPDLGLACVPTRPLPTLEEPIPWAQCLLTHGSHPAPVPQASLLRSLGTRIPTPPPAPNLPPRPGESLAPAALAPALTYPG